MGIPTRKAFLDEGGGPVHLSNAQCTSKKMNLLDCAIDKNAVNGCDHSEDAGVICKGECVQCIHVTVCVMCTCVCVCVCFLVENKIAWPDAQPQQNR